MTTKDIEDALPGATIWDKGSPGSVPGLQLRAFQNKKCFYVFYRFHRRARRPKIGQFGIITLSEARDIARRMLAQVTMGQDPSLMRQELRDEKVVSDAFWSIWETHWSKERFQKSGWGPEVKRLYLKHIDPRFSGFKLSELTFEAVELWHQGFADTSIYEGNRALEVLSTIYKHAMKKRWTNIQQSPCFGVSAFKEVKRKRFASGDELKRLGEIFEREKEKFPREVAFLKFLLFTGTRPSLLERARPTDVTMFHDGTGMLSLQGKMDEDTVHLSTQAVDLLSVFGEHETLTGMTMPRQFWERVRKEAGCPDLWARDFRRTFATVLMSGGENAAVISELLNHKSQQTTKVYAKLDTSKCQELVEKAGAEFEQMLGGGV